MPIIGEGDEGLSNFGDFQFDIYHNGLRGVRPRFPVTYSELERRAHNSLDPAIV